MILQRDSSSKTSAEHSRGSDIKAYPIAAVDEPSLFSTGNKAWETGSLDPDWKPVKGYEGAHRYDPSFEWDQAEEKRVVRKVCCCGNMLTQNTRADIL